MTWWRRRSLRARITILATTVFVLAFTAAILLSVIALTNSLTRALDRSAIRTGNDIAGLVNSGNLPPQLLAAGSGGVFQVQVVNAGDKVVSNSPTADALVSMLRPAELARARTGEVITVPGSRVGTESPMRVVAVRAGQPSPTSTVLVGADVGRLQASAQIYREVGLYAIPVMAAVMAVGTYFIVGGSLRGVSALRRGADKITATGLMASRLPVPQSRDETYRLAVTLNAMLDRLESSTAAQRRFVGDAAHELRSPLASLRTQFEIASMLGPASDWDELVAEAMVDIDRLSRLVDDLLALARSDENQGALRHAVPVDLAGLCRTIVESYGGAPARVTCDSDGTDPTVTGDPDALRRILVNLIDNAVRHAASSVHVRAASGTHDVLLTVADDGPGIPAEQRETVFDRFVRLDAARARDTGGTGLGLSIVREIVSAHGGTITLGDNHPGVLATVTLPAAVTPARVSA